MALIKCTECGKKFSDKAMSCPNCGCPTSTIMEELKEMEQNESANIETILEEQSADTVKPNNQELYSSESKLQDLEINKSQEQFESNSVLGNAISHEQHQKLSRKILAVIIATAAIIACVGCILLFIPKAFSRNAKKISTTAQSVLMLYCYADANANFDQDSWFATGSGFILYNDSTIVTNYHVIEGAEKVFAVSEDNSVFTITTVLAYDTIRDVAILKTDSPTSLRVLNTGDYTKLKKGETVTAIGSPQGLKNIVTSGMYSGSSFIEAYNEELLQFSASISSGSSGGPLFNEKGEVIGMTTASYYEGDNLNFAVPEASIEDVYNNRSTSITLADCAQQEAPGMSIISKCEEVDINNLFAQPEQYYGQMIYFEATVYQTAGTNEHILIILDPNEQAIDISNDAIFLPGLKDKIQHIQCEMDYTIDGFITGFNKQPREGDSIVAYGTFVQDSSVRGRLETEYVYVID